MGNYDGSCHSHQTWDELLGSQNWDGLLEPLDLNLRKFILHCGDFCHMAYDAFTDTDAMGNNASTVASTLDKVKLPEQYQFHTSFYAATTLTRLEKLLHIPGKLFPPAPGEHIPHWMGFCAASKDAVSRDIGRRVIYIAWRGTQRLFEWRNNLVVVRTSAVSLLREFNETAEKKPRVMKGWLSIYTSTEDGKSSKVKTSARDQVRSEVGKLLKKFKGEKISIVVTGHSLGGILAILSAFDLVDNDVEKDIRVTAMVFNCPRVGNKEFRERVRRHSNLSVLHIKNKKDLVPRLPAARRVGNHLVVDSAKSNIPRLRDCVCPVVWHDLETCLHMVAGWNGPEKGFELQVDRSTDRLMKPKEKYMKREMVTFLRNMDQCKNFVESILRKIAISAIDENCPPTSGSESSEG